MDADSALQFATLLMAILLSFGFGYRVGKHTWQSDKAKKLESESKRRN